MNIIELLKRIVINPEICYRRLCSYALLMLAFSVLLKMR